MKNNKWGYLATDIMFIFAPFTYERTLPLDLLGAPQLFLVSEKS
jgi:hypothetical protein